MSEPRYVHDAETHSRASPLEVVPRLVELLEPASVLDVGCGRGAWLSVFREHGCEILGLEGERIPDDLLLIPRARIRRVDLEEEAEPPGRFDLAVSLEVAEHLSPDAGERLVELLTGAADAVLFSAAVPGQGGQNHINERWPSHWVERFRRRGFAVDDAIRWRFWENESVEWWYRQNMFLARRREPAGGSVRSVVHPRLLEKKARIIDDFYHGRVPLRTGVIVFVRSLLNALFRR